MFLWYLRRGVILTKDNLAKRNWKGCTRCYFLCLEECIQHLFFECHVAKLMWNTLYFAFGINPPTCVADLFGSCRRSFPSQFKKKTILVAASALCCALWISRNNLILRNFTTNSPLWVIFRATYWIRSSSNRRSPSWSFSTTLDGRLEIGLVDSLLSYFQYVCLL